MKDERIKKDKSKNSLFKKQKEQTSIENSSLSIFEQMLAAEKHMAHTRESGSGRNFGEGTCMCSG